MVIKCEISLSGLFRIGRLLSTFFGYMLNMYSHSKVCGQYDF